MAPEKDGVESSDVPEVPGSPATEAVDLYTPYYCTWYRFIFPTANSAQVTEEMRTFRERRNQ